MRDAKSGLSSAVLRVKFLAENLKRDSKRIKNCLLVATLVGVQAGSTRRKKNDLNFGRFLGLVHSNSYYFTSATLYLWAPDWPIGPCAYRARCKFHLKNRTTALRKSSWYLTVVPAGSKTRRNVRGGTTLYRCKSLFFVTITLRCSVAAASSGMSPKPPRYVYTWRQVILKRSCLWCS